MIEDAYISSLYVEVLYSVFDYRMHALYSSLFTTFYVVIIILLLLSGRATLSHVNKFPLYELKSGTYKQRL